MKKNAVALALMAISNGAMAQSTVSLFGIVDTGLAYGQGSVSNRTKVMHSGIQDSRLGFRGVEDLGGGLSASFWLEMGFNSDNGTGQTTNINNQTTGIAPGLFNRRSTVSIANELGELRLGRDYVPSFWNLTIFDPFGAKGAGTNLMLPSSIVGPTVARASNSVGYFLPPKLGGWYGQVMYFLGENASNGALTEDDGNGYGARFGYISGPFNLAIATTRTTFAVGDARQTNLAGSWNFDAWRLMAQLSRDGRGSIDGRGALVGGVVAVGVGEIRTSVSRYKTSAAGDPEMTKFSMGYVHHLSKRTALYASAARVRNSGRASLALNGAVTGMNQSSTGYDIGMRHAF